MNRWFCNILKTHILKAVLTLSLKHTLNFPLIKSLANQWLIWNIKTFCKAQAKTVEWSLILLFLSKYLFKTSANPFGSSSKIYSRSRSHWLLALRISTAPNWSLPPPSLPYKLVHSSMRDPFKTKDHVPALLRTVQEPPVFFQTKPRVPNLLGHAWPGPATLAISTPTTLLPTQPIPGISQPPYLWGFVLAVPSAWKLCLHICHMAWSLTLLRSLFKYYLTWSEASFKIVTPTSRPYSVLLLLLKLPLPDILHCLLIH